MQTQYFNLFRIRLILLVGLCLLVASLQAGTQPEADKTMHIQADPWPTQPPPLPSVTEASLAGFLQQAEAGDARARLALALWYLSPRSNPRDREAGITWLNRAASLGEADALYYQGLFASGQDDKEALWKTATVLGSSAAAVGLADRQVELAKSEASPEKAIQHTQDAIRLYTLAVKGGWALAAERLAECYYPVYMEDSAYRLDIVRAYAWRVIAHRGYSDQPESSLDGGKDNLQQIRQLEAMMFPAEKKAAHALIHAWPQTLPTTGILEAVPKPPPSFSTEYFARIDEAIQRQDGAALDALFIEAELPPWMNAGTKEKDFVPLFVDAARAGSAYAINQVAWYQLIGFEMEKDEAAALKTLKARAAKKDRHAFRYLASHAIHTQQDQDNLQAAEKKTQPVNREALRLLKKGAALGDDLCLLLLGHLYQHSEKIDESNHWFEKAATKGSLAALKALAQNADHQNDIRALAKWTAVRFMREKNQADTFSLRRMIALARETDYAEAEKGMAEAARWEQKYRSKRHVTHY